MNSKVVTIDGYEDVPSLDEKALKKAVARQPVSVAIEASGRAFQLYESVSDSIHIRLIELEENSATKSHREGLIIATEEVLIDGH